MPTEPFDTGPLLYFLQHSALFVVGLAILFFSMGILFGWAVWGRYRSNSQELTRESELLKQEIAKLKRHLAEQSLLQQAAPSKKTPPAPAPPLPDITPPTAEQVFKQVGPDKLNSSHSTPAGIVKKTVTVHAKITKSAAKASNQKTPPPTADSGIHLSQLLNAKSSPVALPAFPIGDFAEVDSDQLFSDPDLGRLYRKRPDASDDLNQIKGIGPVLAGRLHACGIFTFSQIANWSSENVQAFSKRLAFKDRIEREDWVGQAKALTQGQSCPPFQPTTPAPPAQKVVPAELAGTSASASSSPQ